ncbi:uridine kinase family protein [Amycolatopsis minnesotensis]
MVAVDGPSGAGKSTIARVLADQLGERVRTLLLSTDDFATWDDPVAWWPRFADGVLIPFSEGRDGGYRRVVWSRGEPELGEFVAVAPPRVLIFEGVSAGRTSISRFLSLLCWVGGPDERERLERAVARDGEGSREHLREWQNFERGWFAVDKTAKRADSPIGLVDLPN